MRSGAWLWLPVALAFSGCQGDYPLEPTACDRYCHATQGLSCWVYNPSQCVLDCEREGGTETCPSQVDAIATCFEQTPGALQEYCQAYMYGFANASACRTELDAYSICRSTYAIDE